MEDLKQYKWLISSCLQKSIRRGYSDLAVGYVKFLWEHDRNYITYRFGTILTEDVGIANLDLVNSYLETKLAKKQIESKGGLDFILDLTKKACDSPKDRSSCDAAYLAGFYGLDTDNAKDIFLDISAHYIDRINSSWYLLGGKKFKNSNLNLEKIDTPDKYLEAVEELTPNLTKTVEYAYLTQVENIALGLPVVWDLYQQELDLPNAGKIVEKITVPDIIVNHKETGLELLSSGIDGHTREGKNIYFKYLNENNAFTKQLKNIPQEDHINILKHCLFRIEGHEVNKRIYFPSAVQIMRDVEQKILNFKTGREIEFSNLKHALLEDMNYLNDMKSRAFAKSVKPTI